MYEIPRPRTRRRFLQDTAALAAGAALLRPHGAEAAARQVKASDKLAIGIIGAGGRGWDNLHGVASERIVAIADVDDVRCSEALKAYPKAAHYRDFRQMLDKEKSLDAVVISTPDHTHAVSAIAAMRHGLNVYCEKPLGARSTSCDGWRGRGGDRRCHANGPTGSRARRQPPRRVEVVRSGAIGEVKELHVWTDRPAGWWPQGEERPKESPPVPNTLNWECWLGPAPLPAVQPGLCAVHLAWAVGLRHWRDWRHGGARSATPRIGCIELGLPTSAEVVAASLKTDDCPPLASIIDIEYPARGSAPPVKLRFYDGKLLPPAELFYGEAIADNGSLIIGSKGTLYTRTWHGGESDADMFLLLPRKEFIGYEPPVPTLPRTKAHHTEWIEACKGGPATQSNFGYASRLTEGLLVGLLAVRVGKRIEWDAAQMRATGCPEADAFIRPQFRSGWEV